MTSRQTGRAGLREIVKYTRRSFSQESSLSPDASDDWIHLSVLRVRREGQTERQAGRQAGQDKKEKNRLRKSEKARRTF